MTEMIHENELDKRNPTESNIEKLLIGLSKSPAAVHKKRYT